MTRDFSASFDSPADRLEWSATKWEKYRGRDVIPLWIADMDYPVAPAIQRAVAAHVRHGNYGYMSAPRELAGDLVAYHAEHYGWQIEPEWIVWLSGLVLGINLAVKACCGDGESVLDRTIKALAGCEVVLCSKIGFEPWGNLEAAGIQPNGEHAMQPIADAVMAVWHVMLAAGKLAAGPIVAKRA